MDVVGIDDLFPQILRPRHFLKAQGTTPTNLIAHQDNQSAIRMEAKIYNQETKKLTHQHKLIIHEGPGESGLFEHTALPGREDGGQLKKHTGSALMKVPSNNNEHLLRMEAAKSAAGSIIRGESIPHKGWHRVTCSRGGMEKKPQNKIPRQQM